MEARCIADETEFEWDEAKRLATLAKHGIDFVRAARVLKDGGLTWRTPHKDEERWIAIGMSEEIEIAVIYTMRGTAFRIITARRARRNERRAY